MFGRSAQDAKTGVFGLVDAAFVHAVRHARRHRAQPGGGLADGPVPATDGLVNDYHIVHLGKFALGKFGIVFTENCAIVPEGG